MAGNIATYQPPDINIRPSEVGAEAFAAAGRRAGAFYNQAGESLAGVGREFGTAVKEAGDTAVDYMDHQQINAGAKHGADLTANLTDSWNQTAAGADPHDPSVAAKWRDQVLEPALDQFTQGFSTEKSQEWSSQFANRMRTEMYRKSEADMSSLAADAVSNTVHTMGNQFSNTAVSDPSSVPFLLSQVDHSIDGVIGANPNLKGADAARVRLEVAEKTKEAIVKAGAFGAIQKAGDPEAAAASWAKQYPDYINGQEELMFGKAAKQYQRMNEAEARNERVMRDYTQKQDWNTKADQLELSTLPQKAGDPPVLPDDYWSKVKQIGTMPGTDPARLRSLIDNGERLTTRLGKPEPLAPISHATTMQILGDMRSGNMPTTDAIYKAYGDNKLNNADFNFLQTQFQQSKTPDGERLDKDRDLFFKRYQFSFDPQGGMGSGDRQPLYEAEMSARQKEIEVRAKGGDPHSVYDPTSPNFFGKPDNIQKYKTPLQGQLTQPAPKGPDVGVVQKGYRFLGGDPSKPESWAKVQ